MIPAKLSWPSQRSEVVNLQGGVDENLGSLQQSPGSLLDVANYMIAEGQTGGYQSIAGYERYDGTDKSSELPVTLLAINDPISVVFADDIIVGDTGSAIALGPSVTEDGIQSVEVTITSDTFIRGEDLSILGSSIGTFRNTKITGPTENFHEGYDTNRALIKPVGDTDCEGPVLGITLFQNMVYAFRKKVSGDFVGMYEATATGWVEVDTSSDPIVYGDNKFVFVQYNFYAGTAGLAMYWIDGVNEARSFDGTTVTSIPNINITPDTPINITARSNRLYLAYTGGSLQYSVLGDPTDWTGASGAGEIGTGDEITNLTTGVGGSLIIFNINSILIVDGETPASWTIKTFSLSSGAYTNTAKRLLGTIFFLDDRGITTLEAVQEYGDYAANSISANFKKTLFDNIDNLTTSIVSRDLNQYRLFFNDGLGIIVSFKAKELQGATFIQYPINVNVTAEGSLANKKNVLLFGTSTPTYSGENVDGYVYLMDSGTSFDSHKIITKMTTSYFHYRSPRQWKRFISAMVEGDTTVDTLFDLKIDYDYGSGDLPTTEFRSGQSGEIVAGSLYGSSEYGSAIYGSGAILSRTPVYLTGFGTNASFKILTNLRFVKQHVIQNLLVDFTILSRRI